MTADERRYLRDQIAMLERQVQAQAAEIRRLRAQLAKVSP